MKKDEYISNDNLILATSKILAIYDTTIILDKDLIESMKEHNINLVSKDYWTLRNVKFKDKSYYNDKYFSNRNIPINPLSLALAITFDSIGIPKVVSNYTGSFSNLPGFFIKKLTNIQNKYFFHGSEENLMMFRLCI